MHSLQLFFKKLMHFLHPRKIRRRTSGGNVISSSAKNPSLAVRRLLGRGCPARRQSRIRQRPPPPRTKPRPRRPVVRSLPPGFPLRPPPAPQKLRLRLHRRLSARTRPLCQRLHLRLRGRHPHQASALTSILLASSASTKPSRNARFVIFPIPITSTTKNSIDLSYPSTFTRTTP